MNQELINKIRVAILDMMTKVQFTDDGHTYKNTKTGDWLQGVSTVSSIIPKDWLSAWGAKEAVKFLGYSDYDGDTDRAFAMKSKIVDLNVEEYISLLKEAKGAAGRKSKTALVDGKQGHAWLEKYVKAKIRGQALPKLLDEDEPLYRPLNEFTLWESEFVNYWILAEARVAYPAKGYAGTMDALAMMKTGKLAVIDFKFASHISEDYFLQTAGYAACFEPYHINIDERIIIRLPKTLQKEEWDKKKHQYNMVDNNLEIHKVKTNYEVDRDTFFHCLYVKKWINQFKQ